VSRGGRTLLKEFSQGGGGGSLLPFRTEEMKGERCTDRLPIGRLGQTKHEKENGGISSVGSLEAEKAALDVGGTKGKILLVLGKKERHHPHMTGRRRVDFAEPT